VRSLDTKKRSSSGKLPRSAPRWLAERSFRQRDIPAVRQFARAFGARARLHPARLTDFVLSDYVSVVSDSDGIWVLLSMTVA
jgi:hypothetical protein